MSHNQSKNEKLSRQWINRICDRNKIPRRLWYPVIRQITIDDAEEWQRQNDVISNTIRRTVLMLVIYSMFCIIMLSSPDAHLISASEKIILPFTDTKISYQGFLYFGPLILIGFAIYLHVNINQLNKLALNGKKFPLPFIFNQQNTSAAVVSGFLFYWLVPIVLIIFTWKSLPRSGLTPFLLVLLTTIFTGSLVWVQIRRLNRTKRMWWFRIRMMSFLCICAGLFGLSVAQVLMYPKLIYSRPLYLYGANLNKQDLSGTNLLDADLTKASLVQVDLDNANLRNSKMWKAKLKKSNISNADLTNAYLKQADLSNAELNSAILNDANLTNANLNKVNLSGAELENANLSRARLEGAILGQATLTEANLTGANLAGASLYAAILNDAKLGTVSLSTHKGAETKNTILSDANLFKATLWNSDLSFANLSNANLREVDLTEANLNNAILRAVDLTDANLEYASIKKADLTNATLKNANLYGADLTKTTVTCEQLSTAKNWKYATLGRNCER